MWKYLVVLGAAGLLLWNKAMDVMGKIRYEFKSIRLGDINPFSSTIKINYSVENNNPWLISIDRFQGVVTQNGILLSELNIPSKIELASGEEVTLTIDAPIKNANLLYRIEEIIRSGGWDLLHPIKIEGALTINGVQLPIKESVKILDY